MVGAADEGAPVTFNAFITTGDGVNLDIDCGQRGWFHVKVSRYGSLRSQFEAFRVAYHRFPTFVPEPLAYYDIDGLAVLIARSVKWEPLRRSDLSMAHWHQQLVEFFVVARTTAPDPAASGLAGLESTLGAFFASLDGADSPRCRYLRRTLGAVAPFLPAIPQHGDFEINNLGRRGRALVVFDWEDYGAIDAAGLDICLLALSAARKNPEVIRDIRDSPDPRGKPWAFAKAACDAIGLDFGEFRRLLPLYLLIFRYLKRNYATRIRDTSDRLCAAALS